MTEHEREMLRHLYRREQQRKGRGRFYGGLLCIALLLIALRSCELLNNAEMGLLGVTLGSVFVIVYGLAKFTGWIIRNWRRAAREALPAVVFVAVGGVALVAVAVVAETWIFPPIEARLGVEPWGGWSQAMDYAREGRWEPLVVYVLEGMAMLWTALFTAKLAESLIDQKYRHLWPKWFREWRENFRAEMRRANKLRAALGGFLCILLFPLLVLVLILEGGLRDEQQD